MSANRVRHVIVTLFSTRPRYFSRLTMFFCDTIVMRILPTSFKPSIIVAMNEQINRRSTGIINGMDDMSIVDRINYGLVVVVRSFMDRINRRQASNTFHTLGTFRYAKYRFMISVSSIEYNASCFQVMCQYMKVNVRFFRVVAYDRSWRRDTRNGQFMCFSFRAVSLVCGVEGRNWLEVQVCKCGMRPWDQ